MPLHHKSQALRDKISILPETPGVYTYYDAAGTVIYVGKAKNLKRRVSSYFNRRHPSARTNMLVRAIADMTYVVVPTEQDALNLENSMIKEFKPRYNVLLKDDKSYPWIVVTNEYFPRVFMTRNVVRDGSRYFGPYTDLSSARAVLDLIRELYPLRTCRHAVTPEYLARGKGKLCLEYHMKKCGGCCVPGMVSQPEYAEQCAKIRQILRGETQEIVAYLRAEIAELAGQLRFEEAHVLKLKLEAVERYQSRSAIVSTVVGDVDVFALARDAKNVYVNHLHVHNGYVVRALTLTYKSNMEESDAAMLSYAISEIAERFNARFREIIVPELPETEFEGVSFIVPQRGDRHKLLQVSTKNAEQYRIDAQKQAEKLNPEQRTLRILQRIQSDFRLPELPRHIECFDNSNIQGTNPVASCVVFRNAKPSKKDYRHFNIRTVDGPDDFASMKEILTRRYTRLMTEAPDDLPQLIVVDGGKGQLSSAVEALESIGLRGVIPVVGIAKRLEEIYFPGDSVPLYIDKNSETLKVVQHLRDEAHRFGITHHRNKRSKSQSTSQLDLIPGIGPKTKQLLLSHFRSVSRLRQAPLDEISGLVGKSKAEKIHLALNQSID